MSNRNDIRMYVERLFEGRTLDAETIELKEEIYGNLVARFDDYVAQGMSEDEAYQRTCEAVTSVDDVIGEKGAADGETVATEAPAPTTVMPAVAPGPSPDVPPAPGAGPAPATAPRAWSTGKIVAVVAAAVVVVGVAVAVIFGLFLRGNERAQVQSDVPAVVTTEPTTTEGTTQTTDPMPTTTGNGNSNGNAQGAAPKDGTGQQNGHGTGAQGLDAEILNHSVDSLASFSGTQVSDSSRIAQLVASLPLGSYATEVNVDAPSGTVAVTYTYPDRDQLAYDDDCVDRALAYDAVAMLSAIDTMGTLRVTEIESSPHDPDREMWVFDRGTVEQIVGTQLDSSVLNASSWDSLRTQLMGEYTWDPILETAERS